MSTSFSRSPYAGTSYSGADMMATLMIKNTDNHKNAVCTLGELQTLSYSTHMDRGAVRKLGNINVSDFTNGPRTIAGSLVFAVFNRHVIKQIIDQMGIEGEILPDELPPFSITVTFANEYGHSSVLRIYGVRLVNEGEVLSVNDIYIENTYQYVAQNIEILKATDLESVTDAISDTHTNSQSDTNNEPQAPNKDDMLDLSFALAVSDEEQEINSQLAVRVIDNGSVIFDVVNKQPLLKIIIYGESGYESSYSVPDNGSFTIGMGPDKYTATLQLEDKTYNTVAFTVKALRPGAPYITNVTSKTIIGEVADSSVIAIKYSGPDSKEYSVDVVQQAFRLTGLSPDTEYMIQSNANNGSLSEPLYKKTLTESSSLFKDFKAFTKYNNLENVSFMEFIAKAQTVDKPFIEAFHEVYQKEQSKKRSNNNLEAYMHLVSYYDLAVKQKDFDFDLKNKWLSDIRCGKNASDFRVYSSKGMAQTPQKASGYLKYQQVYQQAIEKLTSYKPVANYQHTLQQEYIAKNKLNDSLRKSFNARYGMMPINKDYGFYDYMLNSNGAYIEIIDDKVIPHHRKEDTYIVFKEDLNLDICFKVEATNQEIDHKKLSFFDNRNTYIVYLEHKGQPISKSILIQNGIATYNHDSLLSLGLDRKMQDFIKELCIEQIDLFEMFCFGFYLLVNRKKLTSDYIKFFDNVFYSGQKDARVKFYRDDRYLHFDKEVDFVAFNKQGDYLSTSFGKQFLIQHSGYLVWSTPTNRADCLNFENI